MKRFYLIGFVFLIVMFLCEKSNGQELQVKGLEVSEEKESGYFSFKFSFSGIQGGLNASKIIVVMLYSRNDSPVRDIEKIFELSMDEEKNEGMLSITLPVAEDGVSDKVDIFIQIEDKNGERSNKTKFTILFMEMGFAYNVPFYSPGLMTPGVFF